MRRIVQPVQPKPRSRLGTAVVETAFVIPIFFLVILGVAEFGRAFSVTSLLANAAREGARMAIMNGVTSQEVKEAVAEQVVKTVGVEFSTDNVEITVTPYGDNPDPNNEVGNASTRDLCTIVVSLPYAEVSYIVRFLEGVTLRGQAAMRHE